MFAAVIWKIENVEQFEHADEVTNIVNVPQKYFGGGANFCRFDAH